MQHDIVVTCNKEVNKIADKIRLVEVPQIVKDRSDYFRERRKNKKAFHVEVEKEKMEAFEKVLAKQQKTKKQWLDQKIDEELEEK
ncbi:hypothetical protein C0033_08830 [Clostridium sp. chh4-2]|uniref:hypothetical protein n=1 Tax=Clostridium sp. chh4-2 TaxID=2067550 RepID=UPI000CCEBDB8|nr:hypothetical protein [Clostridium sp. chh4-2]PNV62209.1 hypothetical protein C0033_08830 [Clostridium sp. chh4-2]